MVLRFNNRFTYPITYVIWKIQSGSGHSNRRKYRNIGGVSGLHYFIGVKSLVTFIKFITTILSGIKYTFRDGVYLILFRQCLRHMITSCSREIWFKQPSRNRILHSSFFILHSSFFILHSSFFILHSSFFILQAKINPLAILLNNANILI